MSKSNDKPKQDAENRKKTLPALAKAALFVLAVLVVNIFVLWLYKAQVDNFNAWSGLGFPVYDEESVKTISIAVFAIFSLMAVLWRSIISASQVKELQEQGRRTEKQIENTEKQIQQADEKNLTELFTKGVELINTPEPEKNSALVLAGVSILHQVALKQDGLFSEQVENIFVKGFLENSTFDWNSPSYVWAALNALDEIAKRYNKKIYGNKITITEYVFDATENIYNYISDIFYKDCEISKIEITNNHFIGCAFVDCKIIEEIYVIGGGHFYYSFIKGLCYVNEFGYGEELFTSENNLKFYKVDFTSCNVWKILGDVPMEFEDCFYDPENPPVVPLKTLIDEANAQAAAEAKAIAESEDTTATNIPTGTPTTTPTNDDKQG